ncbi:MAG: helix-turn-helix transcriptional regulator [Clostridia bacterium]|nr:helix-turn-helix transcriptional regulator [Clostridia bacterium]
MKITIGENIRALRTKKGVTQEQLSEVIGVTCAAVSKWERGETYPDITLIFPLAYYFGVSVDELMGYNEGKVEEDIRRTLEEYQSLLFSGDDEAAKRIIEKAYRDYPDNYEIMARYMWKLGIEDAEPDLETALAHKEELTRISDKIIGGCTDGLIRLWAWKMKAVLLHAEGKTDEALKIHSEKFGSWWNSFEQMNEQLFTKDRPEFLYWSKRNMYELAGFAADKISKSIFFDQSIGEEARIEKIETSGDALAEAYAKTGNPVFAVMAESIFGRLSNDIRCRGVGTNDDCERVSEKRRKYRDIVAKLSKDDKELYDSIYGNR